MRSFAKKINEKPDIGDIEQTIERVKQFYVENKFALALENTEVG
jgi:hypothetical protein